MRKSSFLAIACVGLALSCRSKGTENSARESDADEPDNPTKVVDRGCEEADCAHLDSPCVKGSCDESFGVCRTEPVEDGTRCESHPECGPTWCQRGECIPKTPPDCTELDDACHVGRCHPSHGCVALAADVAGRSCETAISLDVRDVPASAEIDKICGEPSWALPVDGRVAYFELDLSFLEEPTDASVVVESEAPIRALIARGACEDLSPISAATDWWAYDFGHVLQASGGEGGRLIFGEELQPERYWLLVGTLGGKDSLNIRVDATIQRTEMGPPLTAATLCDGAAIIDANSGSVSWLGVDEHVVAAIDGCVGDVGSCYLIDVSRREQPSVLTVELWDASSARLLATPNYRGDCSELLGQGEYFSAIVDPGLHPLLVEPYPTPRPFSLRLTVESVSSSAQNDSCETAVVIDPSIREHRLTGNTLYGTTAGPSAPSAHSDWKLFYSLDLSDAPGLTRLSAQGDAHLTVAPAPDGGTCDGLAEGCLWDCDLEAQKYVLMVATDDAPHPFDVTLTLTDVAD